MSKFLSLGKASSFRPRRHFLLFLRTQKPHTAHAKRWKWRARRGFVYFPTGASLLFYTRCAPCLIGCLVIVSMWDEERGTCRVLDISHRCVPPSCLVGCLVVVSLWTNDGGACRESV